MDRYEELAEKYLRSLGFAPVFEPNGSGTFPDFEISSGIAAEVRSLNEHYFNGERVNGLREESQPLYDRMETVLRSFYEYFAGETYFSVVDFERPLPNSRLFKAAFRRVLSDFLKNPQTCVPYQITENISVEFVRASPVNGHTFLFGVAHDQDAGGWVIPNFIKNLKYCIRDKTLKQKPAKDTYREWWLILCDEIARGFSSREKGDVVSAIEKPKEWNRIVVLNNLTGQPILDF